VLDRARRYRKATDGAFDATVRPILNVWKRAAKAGRMPAEEELAEAARLTGAGVLKITDQGASKSDPRVQVDLGGIAKGVGIDRALEAMIAAGCKGAMVEVGGDVRVHGDRGDGGKWRILVRSPFAPGDARGLGILEVESGAVCTSGNYFRFFRIGEKKFSHIVDPRTGRPVDSAPSVTVLASTAEQADAWATALSVLGPEGLKLLKEHAGIEALVITGGPDDYKAHATPGFAAVLAEGPLKRRLADGP
jgi:thiamine biosynthesis lipoprotein